MAEERPEAPAEVIKSEPSVFWCVSNRSGVLRHHWGDDGVVFDSASGATHLLSSDASNVLGMLIEARSPLSVADISNMLLPDSATAPPHADAAVDAAVSSILDELRRIGLAQPETP